MTPNRISIAPRDRLRRYRVAPVWIAVLLALALLAVLGVRGLQRNRETILEQARATSAIAAEQVTRTARAAIAERVAGTRIVRFYPELPKPGPATEAAASFERALSLSEEEANAIFAGIEQEHPDAIAATGLPVLPLIAWTRLQRASGDPVPLAEALAKRVVEDIPSFLSERLLEQSTALLESRGMTTPALQNWQRRWKEDEFLRTSLRAIPTDRERAQWIHPADAGHYWAEPIDSIAWRVTSADAMRQVVADAVEASTPLLPSSVKLSARWAGHDLIPPTPGETLASRDHQNLSVTATLTNPEDLFREQRQQTLWLSGLLAVALLAVLSAFLALQKSLASERQLNQQKSDFVASVSHELRAPVSSMRLMLENLKNGNAKSPAEYVQLMHDECGRLSALIENVLDFARIEHNRKTYEMAEADVVAMIEDVARLLEPRGAQRGQRLTLDLVPIDPAPQVDALALQQAVINLVDNAIKFSPPSTRITIRARIRDSATWEISVSDQGPGVPAGERERIFDRFYRVGSELRRETPGAGIGLAIVKHTIDAHHGRIEIESEKGATFRLILPYIQPPSKP